MWLGLVEAEMITTLRRTQKECTFYYPNMDRIEWIKQNLGLMVNTGAQIWWTYEVLDIFAKVRSGDKMAMKKFAHKCHDLLFDLIVAVRDTGGDKFKTKKINLQPSRSIKDFKAKFCRKTSSKFDMASDSMILLCYHINIVCKNSVVMLSNCFVLYIFHEFCNVFCTFKIFLAKH